MKKVLAACFIIVALAIGVYFLFPETLFNIAVKAERYAAGLYRKEIQVDDHRIVYLEGGKGQTICNVAH